MPCAACGGHFGHMVSVRPLGDASVRAESFPAPPTPLEISPSRGSLRKPVLVWCLWHSGKSLQGREVIPVATPRATSHQGQALASLRRI